MTYRNSAIQSVEETKTPWSFWDSIAWFCGFRSNDRAYRRFLYMKPINLSKQQKEKEKSEKEAIIKSQKSSKENAFRIKTFLSSIEDDINYAINNSITYKSISKLSTPFSIEESVLANFFLSRGHFGYRSSCGTLRLWVSLFEPTAPETGVCPLNPESNILLYP